MAHVACSDELPDAAGGDSISAQRARRVDGDTEAEFVSEGFERFDPGFGTVAETKVLSFVQLDDGKSFLENLRREGSGTGVGQLPRKGKNERGIDAGGGEKVEFL